jgi:hypothetical protein
MAYYRRRSLVPVVPYTVPLLDHQKYAPYLDYPLIAGETVSLRPFYVEYDFIYCSSDEVTTSLHKWNGNSYTEVPSYTNPDVIAGRGWFAITTTANNYVTITEMINQTTRDAL